MASNQKTTSLKTLKKWEKEYNVKLDFDINSQNKVFCIRSAECDKWEKRIKDMKNFSQKWIKGTESVAKDAVEKHVKGEPRLRASKLSKQSELGAEVYRDCMIMNSPLAKSFLRLNPADKNSLQAKFKKKLKKF